MKKKKDWFNFLSQNEKQKLNFGRILYHEPKFVILDESMKNLPKNEIIYFYELFIKHDINFISISHLILKIFLIIFLKIGKKNYKLDLL
jgi:ABC-type uncharacterized transport system fused permease/ATPase subunit